MRRLSRAVGLTFGIFVASALVLIWDDVATSAEPDGARPTLRRAIQMQRRHTPRLLSIRDVVGTATGVDRRGRFAIKVYARKGKTPNVPSELDGVPVVVEATGTFYALQKLRHRQPDRRHRRPVPWRGPRRRPPSHRPPRPHDLPPTVLIVSPADGEAVSGDVLIAAIAEDDEEVVSVEFFVDNMLVGVDIDGTDGWNAVWDSTLVEDGALTLLARATDSIGQESEDEVGILVGNEDGPFSPDGRPVPIGVSTGNAKECSSGTIACRVRDSSGTVYALSNSHVYARLNQAALGESIVQPGLFDTDCRMVYADQVIGVLAEFVPLDFRTSASNQMDAAIALTTVDDVGRTTPSDGYGLPKSEPVAASIDQLVQKYGRTTLLTEGFVSGIGATVVVSYGDRSARFTNQIIVSGNAFIDAGDSGSLLVTHDPDPGDDGGRAPVGLLFAGTSDGSTAIACPIQDVLDAFDVAIDGE